MAAITLPTVVFGDHSFFCVADLSAVCNVVIVIACNGDPPLLGFGGVAVVLVGIRDAFFFATFARCKIGRGINRLILVLYNNHARACVNYFFNFFYFFSKKNSRESRINTGFALIIFFSNVKRFF